MEQKYVICPWCQQVMYPIQQVIEDGMIRRGPEQLRNYYYECECGAESPAVYKVCTHEEAESELADLLNIDTSLQSHTYLVLYSGHDRSTKVATDTFSSCSTGEQLVEDAKTYLRNKLGYDNLAVWNICKLD